MGNSHHQRTLPALVLGRVYEVSIAPFTAAVTLLALLNPRLGKFDVTDKGTNIAAARFDFGTSCGTLLLCGPLRARIDGRLPAAARVLRGGHRRARGAARDPDQRAWALANLTTLVAAACVAYEQPQQRKAPRVTRDFPCEVRLAGKPRRARCLDISESGVRVELETPVALPDVCEIGIAGERGTSALQARRVWCEGGAAGQVQAGLAFEAYGAEKQRELVELIFSDDRSWLRSTYPRDDPFRSFGYLLTTIWRVTRPRRSLRRRAPRLQGRWPIAIDGQRGVCVSLSALGGLVEVEPPPATAGVLASRSLRRRGAPLALRGRIVRSEGSRVALAWEGEDVGALETFLASWPAARGPVRRPFWKRAEAMRT